MAVALLSGQVLSAAHTHDHSDDEPFKNVCEVCILAVNDETEIVASFDQTDMGDAVSWWVQIDRLSLPEPKAAPLKLYAIRSIDPPPDPNLGHSSARAPPLSI
jgi:hypothetical protein